MGFRVRLCMGKGKSVWWTKEETDEGSGEWPRKNLMFSGYNLLLLQSDHEHSSWKEEIQLQTQVTFMS